MLQARAAVRRAAAFNGRRVLSSKIEEWNEIATKELRGKTVESLTWNTPEGIALKPMYTAEDLPPASAAGSAAAADTLRIRHRTAGSDAAAQTAQDCHSYSASQTSQRCAVALALSRASAL